jgi:methylated-DNA-[protein]-cysteine S-methyltransferase
MSGEIGPAGIHALRFPRGTALRIGANGAGRGRTRIAMHAERPGAAGSDWLALVRFATATTSFLDAYFRGETPAEEPALDLTGYPEFDRLVWQTTRRIGHGSTRTYGELACQIGRPGAARAVGGALGRNPLVLVVPCHRVLARAPGRRRLGGFTGGVELKSWLLHLEHIENL